MLLCAFIMIMLTASSEGSIASNINFKEAKMPPNCTGKNFCFEKSHDYPQNIIDGILKKINQGLVEGQNQFANRNGYEKPENDCQKQINFQPIYEILDTDGNVRYVVQSDEKYVQIIRTESCMNPGRIDPDKSRYFEPSQLMEWDLICSEKRIEYWFLSLSLDGTRVENVKLKDGLPICCSCRLEPAFKK